MAPLFATDWTDPTLLFGVNCLFSVCFVSGDAATKSLVLRELSTIPSVLAGFLADPCFPVAIVCLLVVRFIIGDGARALTAADKRRAGWYLWNGIIFHIMMDGMAGGKWGNKLMADNYAILDRRFTDHSHPGDQASAALLVNMELFFHSIMCFATYVGIVTGAVWACEMEIATTMLQLVGMVMFIGPDYLTGCMNMVPHNVSGCIPGFTPFECFYYWFGVGVNLVWGYVPAMLMIDAFKRSAAMKHSVAHASSKRN